MPENFTKETFDYLPDIELTGGVADRVEDVDGDAPHTSHVPAQDTDGNDKGENGDQPDKFIDFEGERIPIEQAQEWLSKGKDATRKWQEAADLKREAEAKLQKAQWVEELEMAWQSGPDGQKNVIDSLMRMAGFENNMLAPNNSGLPANIDLDDISDEGKLLFAENKQLKSEILQMKSHFDRALQTFEGYVNENKFMDQAQSTAQKLKAEFGAEVTAQELRDIVKKTGVQDFEAAWLKENVDNLKKGMFQAGHEAASKKKPNSPGGSTRTFNVNDPGMTADKMARLLREGFVPSE